MRLPRVGHGVEQLSKGPHIAGLGGAFFTVGSNGTFDQDVSAGNGFIALAAIIMGRWHPIGASFAPPYRARRIARAASGCTARRWGS